MFRLVLITSVILLSSCSHIPETIRKAPLQDIQIQDTEKDFSKHQYKTARWGGTLIDVKNDEAETTLQLLAFPLNYYGRPNLSASTLGRFLVRSNDFLDPALYVKSSELTVSGRLVDLNTRKVGQKVLSLPVIELQQIYLWPEYRPTYYCGDGYSPYYSSYHYGGYGYRRSHYRSYGYYGHGRHYY